MLTARRIWVQNNQNSAPIKRNRRSLSQSSLRKNPGKLSPNCNGNGDERKLRRSMGNLTSISQNDDDFAYAKRSNGYEGPKKEKEI